MENYGIRPQELLKEGLITETEYDLKLALEENKELKVKLDAIVKAARLGLELASMLNHPYEYDIEQALAQAKKGT